MMDISQMDESTRGSIEFLFKSIAGLPEVKEDELEPGTYTNAQIIEKLPNPIVLTQKIYGLPKGELTPESQRIRRKELCRRVDEWIAAQN